MNKMFLLIAGIVFAEQTFATCGKVQKIFIKPSDEIVYFSSGEIVKLGSYLALGLAQTALASDLTFCVDNVNRPTSYSIQK